MCARGARGPGHRWGFQGSDPRTLCGQAVRNVPLEVAACAPEAHVDPVTGGGFRALTPEPYVARRCATSRWRWPRARPRRTWTRSQVGVSGL